jgi:hypothetical protein
MGLYQTWKNINWLLELAAEVPRGLASPERERIQLDWAFHTTMVWKTGTAASIPMRVEMLRPA